MRYLNSRRRTIKVTTDWGDSKFKDQQENERKQRCKDEERHEELPLLTFKH
jgi:hypothetical protein